MQSQTVALMIRTWIWSAQTHR